MFWIRVSTRQKHENVTINWQNASAIVSFPGRLDALAYAHGVGVPASTGDGLQVFYVGRGFCVRVCRGSRFCCVFMGVEDCSIIVGLWVAGFCQACRMQEP